MPSGPLDQSAAYIALQKKNSILDFFWGNEEEAVSVMELILRRRAEYCFENPVSEERTLGSENQESRN